MSAHGVVPITHTPRRTIEYPRCPRCHTKLPHDEAAGCREIAGGYEVPPIGWRPTLVYVSGPLTTGNTIDNIRRALEVGDTLIRRGYGVIIPHEKALGSEMLFPRSYHEWLSYDFRTILACDALLRMPGESKGGDEEVAFAVRRGIRVYSSLDLLLAGEPVWRPVS